MGRIEAVIFDMDGLLVGSEHLWREAEAAALQAVGVPMTADDGRLTMGLRTDEVVEFWHARHPWESPSKIEVEAEIHRQVIELIVSRAEALPGAVATVELLAAAGYRLGLASSSSSDIIAVAVGKIGIAHHLQVLQSAEHEPYGKPHPAVYIEAARRLGVAAERCVAFEDSPAGLLAAKAARMRCIAVPDAAMRAHPWFCIADLVLESLTGFRVEMLERL